MSRDGGRAKLPKLVLALLTLIALKATVAMAQTEAAAPRPLTAADISVFLNGAIPTQLDQLDIPGATVAVVKDGHILFAKGYGHADGARTKPVDAAGTLFRPGSTSKLFTWTAVMQMVEQGKIDLDRDVNAYLDFKIPPAFGKPITMRHLLTHTPGFEDRLRDFFRRDVRNIIPLGEALKRYMPRRIFPPGEVPAYSNYGAGLAGYIVERVSGEPFADYVQRHIFDPLGMTRTSMKQPLPPRLIGRMSEGFAGSTAAAPQWYVYTQWPPAGAASTTATDMARFMIAHLQNGQLGTARILRPETAALMHRRHFSAAPNRLTNGAAYGFYESSRNGVRIIGHDGGTPDFSTTLRLIPAHGLGIFLSVNGRGAEGGSGELIEDAANALIDRYFPVPARSPPVALPPAEAHGAALAGNYISSRRIDSHFFRFGQLLGQTSLVDLGDGGIELDGRRWREIEPDLWQQENGQARMAAVRDESGRLRFLADDMFPTTVLEPVPFHLDKSWNLPLFLLSLTLLATTLIAFSVSALARRHYATPLAKEERLASLLIPLNALLLLVFFGFWFWYFSAMLSMLDKLNTGFDPWLRAVQLVGLIAVAGTAYTVFHAIRLWRRGNRSLWVKVGITVTALAAIDLLWIAVTFRLLWPSLG